MGIGIVSIQTNQKKEQAGPPFASGSADNGLSVAPAGEIVLGNDVGQAGSPAELFSDREISMGANPFAVLLVDNVNGASTRMDGGTIQVSETLSNINAGISASSNSGFALASIAAIASNGSTAVLSVRGDSDVLQITAQGSGFISFVVGAINVWSINTSTFFTQIGPTLVASNGATLQVSGTLTARAMLAGIGAGATNIDRDLDSGKLFFNTAAATINLPIMAGASFRGGFNIRVNVANAGGITIQANAGQIIRFGSLVTSTGGTLSSTDVGAYVRIYLIDPATWVTETFNGAWVLT